MVTFLSGGTGTPKLLPGAESVFDPADTTVICNTGDDVAIAGHLVCPDLDTVLFERGGVLDRERWWGIEGDSTETHDELRALSEEAGFDAGPRYLSDERQIEGRDLARWRRFSGVGEFMTIGDRDRAVHLFRTSLLDEGHSLTETTERLADAFSLDVSLLPMSDDPVATIIHTPEGTMHFQEFWVAHGGEPAVEDVEFRGTDDLERGGRNDSAAPTAAVRDALAEPVVIGPSNPVTSLGPLLALDDVPEALAETTVVAVSPFVGEELFSGPAAKLMAAVGVEPSTAGVAESYPFADAFVIDDADPTDLGRPTVTTDITIDDGEDSTRVAHAVEEALELGREVP
ncbi:2-phospho-L-lactate transferase [Halococcus saccharolyticus]|uniref:2-phospho-L-lactate transferase n=1 Tax=Halococcus saccharolyticus DSM 5350 TaxID=1227455 RepID=M0MN12_9EURY|nr:2-phospho-L-lactate transferase [Halococcus saccharolyticus]EMA46129.1 LPPG:FO 2-phospho-L-lactate transferase [Halococcus saccharolyticus DSM 5350]